MKVDIENKEVHDLLVCKSWKVGWKKDESKDYGIVCIADELELKHVLMRVRLVTGQEESKRYSIFRTILMQLL